MVCHINQILDYVNIIDTADSIKNCQYYGNSKTYKHPYQICSGIVLKAPSLGSKGQNETYNKSYYRDTKNKPQPEECSYAYFAGLPLSFLFLFNYRLLLNRRRIILRLISVRLVGIGLISITIGCAGRGVGSLILGVGICLRGSICLGRRLIYGLGRLYGLGRRFLNRSRIRQGSSAQVTIG